MTSTVRAFERIKVARDGPVETITLSNPKRRNAIGPRMMTELWWALDDARASDDVRAIVLTGEGSAFCSVASILPISRVISPLISPRAFNVSRTCPACPRKNSSWIFVTSRAITT